MAVREGLLALLDRRSAYGYQLKTEFESATGGVWSLNVGQVYATLDRLTRDGLVVSEERDGQRSYRLTEAGLDELGAWWETVPGDEPPPRDELTVKVLLAIAHSKERGLDVITQQRGALLMLLQRRQRATTRKAAPNADPLIEQLVRDALIVRAEADLRWLDLCEERLTARKEPASNQPEVDEQRDAKRGRTRARANRKAGA
jgi:DNA-binding PadR family transcriptional regulator